jgi:hypothetical protein
MPAVSIPAPVGGWNARDALDAMKPTDAVALVNWIPRATYVESRRGASEYATGLGATVESLIPFRGTSAQKMLGAANLNIWDISSGGAAVSLKSGLTNNNWQSTHHSNRVIMCNGADTPQVYDGSSITDIVATGPTVTTLWGCNTFKGRVFYWAQNKQSFWYAAAGAFQGTLTEFNLAPIAGQGGTLVQMLTWTIDAGDGVDDVAVFLFSTGEALVYQGDDPGSATAWALVGRFSIGEPISIRSHARVSGTEIIATKDGYLDLSAALKDGRYSENSAYSDKIASAAQSAAKQYASASGWACVLYPAGNLFLVNIPISTTESIQHVRETAGGGWCSFTGWNARSFAVYNDLLYFGAPDGNVYLADTGLDDDGLPIALQAMPAFNSLGSLAQRKQMTAVSIVSNYTQPGLWALDGLADFVTTTRSTVSTDTAAAVTGSDWDDSPWDTSDWDSALTPTPSAQPRAWRNCAAAGYALTVSLRLNSLAQSIAWYSTGIQFKAMGVI